MHVAPFERVGAFDRQPLRHECAVARGDQHGRRVEAQAVIGARAPAAVLGAFERLDALAEMDRRIERAALVEQPLHQFARGARHDRRNVVDRLVRIQFGALTADALRAVDEMTGQADHAGLERREQADGPRADDQHVGLYRRTDRRGNGRTHIHASRGPWTCLLR